MVVIFLGSRVQAFHLFINGVLLARLCFLQPKPSGLHRGVLAMGKVLILGICHGGDGNSFFLSADGTW